MSEFGKPEPLASGNVPSDTKTNSTNANVTPQRERERGAVRNTPGVPMTSPSTPANPRSVVR